ncbi:methyltransferase domain-containing protein [Acidobacteria bacterium AB60]|nr:methyltransferase domain-containing protein [Acidobacteria bacterium AB60]
MTDIVEKAREYYAATRLVDRIQSALLNIAPEQQALTVAQLAPLDQFHTRGLPATAELAHAAGITAGTRVLDLGCGIGGPARYLASTFGCRVVGVDLSPGFIETATYLSRRTGLSDRVLFEVGDAQRLPFPDAAFDLVFLQHVAMNIADRAALYSEVRRVLAPAGRLATYDIFQREGDVVYPVPWARDASASFLLTENQTRSTLEKAGFHVTLWRDDTQVAAEWFHATMAGPPPGPLNLGLVLGADFRVVVANLARNLREERVGVLSAVLTRS